MFRLLAPYVNDSLLQNLERMINDTSQFLESKQDSQQLLDAFFTRVRMIINTHVHVDVPVITLHKSEVLFLDPSKAKISYNLDVLHRLENKQVGLIDILYADIHSCKIYLSYKLIVVL